MIQTFFVDDEMQELLELDGVVTLVDAGHLALHLEDSSEAQEQIAFADVIVLNKIDLVSGSELDALEQRIRVLNAVATIHRVEQAAVPVADVVGVGGFDLSRGLELDAELLTPSFPFEWLGVYDLRAGRHTLVLGADPDPGVDLLLRALPEATDAAVDGVLREAMIAFSDEATPIADVTALSPSGGLGTVPLKAGGTSVPVEISAPGAYALFTEHGAQELGLHMLGPDGTALGAVVDRQIAPDHEHDDTITSVGITEAGELDSERFNAWMGKLLQEQGQDIFRMKGVLSVDGMGERFVFQAVHMLFDGRVDRPWGEEERTNKLVFIGRELDREALEAGFRACLV